MFVSINQHLVELKTYNCFEEMYDFLENCGSLIVLEKKDGNKNEGAFYVLAVHRNQSVLLAPSELNQETFGIGISSYENIPTVLSIPEKNLVILGLDNEVIGISLEDKSILFNISLMNLPFHGFFRVFEEKLVLIFYELGVIAINYEGKEIWAYDRDVLCDAIIDRNKLILELLDLGTIVINIRNGKLLE